MVGIPIGSGIDLHFHTSVHCSTHCGCFFRMLRCPMFIAVDEDGLYITQMGEDVLTVLYATTSVTVHASM